MVSILFGYRTLFLNYNYIKLFKNEKPLKGGKKIHSFNSKIFLCLRTLS